MRWPKASRHLEQQSSAHRFHTKHDMCHRGAPDSSAGLSFPIDGKIRVQFATNEVPDKLLEPDEREPVTVRNETGESPFLLAVDHAGNLFPRALGRLGVPADECRRHIAWDIGIAEVTRLIGVTIDAMVIQQNYSRLVIDCNRPPGSPTSIPEVSELTAIPGNVGLSDRQRAAREREIFRPYHRWIADELDRRRACGRGAILIAMHSFTPVFKRNARPWHIGALYGRDPRLAQVFLTLLRREAGLVVGDNEPYSVTDTSDFTIPVHGEQRGLLHLGIEIRQDLVAEETGQRDWANRLARVLRNVSEVPFPGNCGT
jgi:predicted N-formylglutamate amidohydrolase